MDRNLSECTSDAAVVDYTNRSVPTALLYSQLDTIITSVVNPCLLALGLTGNLAFLFVMIRVRKMWTVTNFYLINMAVADTTFLTVGVSEKLASYLSSPVKGDRDGFGRAGCIATIVLLNMSYFASLFLVTLVSMEKFYAICRPVQHRIIGGKKRTARLVIGAWLLALAFALALLPVWVIHNRYCIYWPPSAQYQQFPRYIGRCQAIKPWFVDFHNGFQTIPFFLTLILNLVFYVKIIKQLSSRIGTVSTEQDARSAQRQKVRNQVAMMLIANGLAFFVCLAPFQITSFSRTITGITNNRILTNEQYNVMLWVGRIFTYVNPVINPIIYNLTNPRYRQAFFEGFTCQVSRRHVTDLSGTQEDTLSTLRNESNRES